jgi:DNA-binding Lrp family transcriptional regulator
LTILTIPYFKETILKLITANSRSNISEIAKKINITPEATAKRLKNLVKSDMIVGYKPRINFTKLGYEYFHVFISTKTPYFSMEIVNYYKLHPDCVFIGELMGYYDLWLEFVVKTTQNFRRVLTDLRNKFGQKINEYEPLQIYTEYRINPLPS